MLLNMKVVSGSTPSLQFSGHALELPHTFFFRFCWSLQCVSTHTSLCCSSTYAALRIIFLHRKCCHRWSLCLQDRLRFPGVRFGVISVFWHKKLFYGGNLFFRLSFWLLHVYLKFCSTIASLRSISFVKVAAGHALLAHIGITHVEFQKQKTSFPLHKDKKRNHKKTMYADFTARTLLIITKHLLCTCFFKVSHFPFAFHEFPVLSKFICLSNWNICMVTCAVWRNLIAGQKRPSAFFFSFEDHFDGQWMMIERSCHGDPSVSELTD